MGAWNSSGMVMENERKIKKLHFMIFMCDCEVLQRWILKMFGSQQILRKINKNKRKMILFFFTKYERKIKFECIFKLFNFYINKIK